MANKGVALRVTTAALGGILLAGVASAAFAEDVVGDPDAVDVSVTIDPVTEPGVLAMTVSGDSTSLVEGTSSDPTVREFGGQLPTVTVTDTRTADEIPEGAYWYVIGTATDFVGDSGQPPISAGHLGWTPTLDDPDGTGAVAPGDTVDTVLDSPPNNVGLVGQELLAMALTSEEAVGSWDATASLLLKVPSTVAPGGYASTLTLSLFE
jgi:hypothetical protein